MKKYWENLQINFFWIDILLVLRAAKFPYLCSNEYFARKGLKQGGLRAAGCEKKSSRQLTPAQSMALSRHKNQEGLP